MTAFQDSGPQGRLCGEKMSSGHLAQNEAKSRFQLPHDKNVQNSGPLAKFMMGSGIVIAGNSEMDGL